MFIQRSVVSLFCASLLVSCSCGTTYVRVPSVCPRDPLCLDMRPGSPEAPARERDFIRRHASSTVEVRGSRYLPNKGPSVTNGVGSLIGSKGYVLTAFHLVDGAEQVTVAFRELSPDGRVTMTREAPAIPLVLSREADMALLVLRAGESVPPSLPVRTGPVIKGDPVWFIGAGASLKHGGVVETGIVDGPDRDHADSSIESSREDAGAPLMNVCGEVVGVTVGPYGKRGSLRFMPIDAALKALSMSIADLR